jgi:hypothetical protein
LESIQSGTLGTSTRGTSLLLVLLAIIIFLIHQQRLADRKPPSTLLSKSHATEPRSTMGRAITGPVKDSASKPMVGGSTFKWQQDRVVVEDPCIGNGGD